MIYWQTDTEKLIDELENISLLSKEELISRISSDGYIQITCRGAAQTIERYVEELDRLRRGVTQYALDSDSMSADDANGIAKIIADTDVWDPPKQVTQGEINGQ